MAAWIDLVLAVFKDPGLVADLRDRPLPEDVGQAIRLAAGESAALLTAQEMTGLDGETLIEASVFFLQQLLFAPQADSYRVLGVQPDAPQDQLREHYRWLIKWLHPDRNQDGWEAVYTDRVNVAWQDLKTPARRAEYDRRLQAMPAPLVPVASVRRRPVATGVRTPLLSGSLVRRLPVIVLGSVGGLAVLLIAGMYWAQVATQQEIAERRRGGPTRDPVPEAAATVADADPLPAVEPAGRDRPDAPASEGRSSANLAGPATRAEPVIVAPGSTDATLAMDPTIVATDTAEPLPAVPGVATVADVSMHDAPAAVPGDPEPAQGPATAVSVSDADATISEPAQTAIATALPALATAPVMVTEAVPAPEPAPAPMPRVGLPEAAVALARPAPAAMRVASVPAPMLHAPTLPEVASDPRPVPATRAVVGTVAGTVPVPSSAAAIANPVASPQSVGAPVAASQAPPAGADVAASSVDAAAASSVHDASLSAAIVTAPPPSAAVAADPPATPPRRADAEALVREFVAAYAAGDLGRFDRLFSRDAVRERPAASMRSRLGSTEMRFLEIQHLQWQMGAVRAQASARFRDTYVPKGSRKAVTESGVIEWVIEGHAGEARISVLALDARP
ncbi:MAG: DnaJ domain-containing protein [Xanthomonadales bacterium]|nr:Chaperone protein DnaJ [Xanthomonadales bacterium]MCC6594774.1 DnaJ domain-containing protein [Xanthomonadales bacterium]MCE7931736.1 hypothetical protein [Xanthomonadales bacterium PRO6]